MDQRAAIAVASLAVVAAVQVPLRDVQAQEWRTDFTRRTVPLEEIVPGGPPKDGIPSIDRPRFETISAADRWLSDREPVAVLAIAGVARAYPLRILIWHEIVNDEVAGRSVAVTFCPLCNTALAFDRTVDGRVLEFIAAPVMSWREFRGLHPAGRVLSRDTGFDRPYGRNPYERYDSRSSPLAGFFRDPSDDRLPAMERVAAIELPGASLAVAFPLLRERRVVNERAGDVPVVVLWRSGTASALDAATIADGRDVGATSVFDRRVRGRTLTFEPLGEGMMDRETGSRWDAAGRAVSGALAGSALTPVPHGNHFWFAWVAFRPSSRLVR